MTDFSAFFDDEDEVCEPVRDICRRCRFEISVSGSCGCDDD